MGRVEVILREMSENLDERWHVWGNLVEEYFNGDDVAALMVIVIHPQFKTSQTFIIPIIMCPRWSSSSSSSSSSACSTTTSQAKTPHMISQFRPLLFFRDPALVLGVGYGIGIGELPINVKMHSTLVISYISMHFSTNRCDICTVILCEIYVCMSANIC